MSVNLVRGASKTGISSSFDVAKVIAVDMDMFPPTQAFRGYISMITVQVSNLSAVSKPTTLTMRICRDAAGDEMIITDTTSNIFYGITDNTDGTAIFALNGFTGLNESDDLYCFVKVNQGTCDVDFFEIVWQGDR